MRFCFTCVMYNDVSPVAKSEGFLYIIIIILVALLLLKLGLGLFSPFAHGLFRKDSPSPTVTVDCLLPSPASLARFGIAGRSIMLPRYKGPISLSLTLLFLRGIAETCGSCVNLSGLSVPSAFFSPARTARSLSIAALWERRLR